MRILAGTVRRKAGGGQPSRFISAFRIRTVPLPAYKLVIFDFDGTLGDTMGWMLDASDSMADKFGFQKIDRTQLDTLRHMSAREMMKLHRLPPLKMPMIAAHF